MKVPYITSIFPKDVDDNKNDYPDLFEESTCKSDSVNPTTRVSTTETAINSDDETEASNHQITTNVENNEPSTSIFTTIKPLIINKATESDSLTEKYQQQSHTIHIAPLTLTSLYTTIQTSLLQTSMDLESFTQPNKDQFTPNRSVDASTAFRTTNHSSLLTSANVSDVVNKIFKDINIKSASNDSYNFSFLQNSSNIMIGLFGTTVIGLLFLLFRKQKRKMKIPRMNIQISRNGQYTILP
ncbi:hypothetical protein RF11_04259 [Thelohanellus kitauei]|uniref:Uncharacterized protein n=1 Tax=Thelohanellus kitauei TaxID=669202 RepID=A0A0C2MBS0_THEKT|nr:hypothetical protein RF11_04259 [Thelohanellus kitauei]